MMSGNVKPKAGTGKLARTLVPLSFLMAGFLLCSLRANEYFSAVPGDLVDARFNSVVLEHLYQWVFGHAVKLWSPTFFYPFPDVLAFSDNHFGTAVVYIVLRYVGFAREPAMAGWILVGNVLNFVTSYYAMRRLGFRAWGAAAGAFVFAFSLPVLAQQGHAQFAYRLFVPLATLTFYQWLVSGDILRLAWCSVYVAAQFFCAIYTGVFTCYLLLAMFLAWGLMRQWPATLACSRTSMSNRGWARLAVALAITGVAVVPVAMLLYKYHEVTKMYGYVRPRGEIISMLPRVWSYFIADFSGLSSWIGHWVHDMPARQEHQLFVGFGVLLFTALGSLVAVYRIEHGMIGMVALLAVLILGAATIDVHNMSFYYLLLRLPGVDSIRAVSRIILVMVFPIGLLVAVGVDRWCALFARHGAAGASIGVVLALVLLGAEPVSFNAGHFPYAAWRAREIAFASRVGSSLAPNSIIFADKLDAADYKTDFDAMIFAQDHGLVTINGYSGYVPPGGGVSDACVSPDNALLAYAKFAGNGLDVSQLRARVVIVPQSKCRYGLLKAMAGNVPAEQARAIRLTIAHVALNGSQLTVDAKIFNDSDKDFSTLDVDGHNVLLSWRLVPEGSVDKVPGWDARKSLAMELHPGQAGDVAFVTQAPAGKYILELSLVQETVEWFHDLGMHIPTREVVIP